LPSAPALILRFSHDDPLARDLATAWIDGTAAVAIDEAAEREWRIFYPDSAARSAARAMLESSCRAHGIALDAVDVEDEDWARRSQAQLKALAATHPPSSSSNRRPASVLAITRARGSACWPFSGSTLQAGRSSTSVPAQAFWRLPPPSSALSV
jgi:hypothetical protein